LKQAVGEGRISYRFITRDRYGRAIVVAWAGDINLSCWQLQRGQAIYKPHWDNGGIIAGACRPGRWGRTR
jgi:endonuclease YncB( thermonuclease family)